MGVPCADGEVELEMEPWVVVLASIGGILVGWMLACLLSSPVPMCLTIWF